jgi:hypothetical protein
MALGQAWLAFERRSRREIIMTPGAAIKRGLSLARRHRLPIWMLFLVNLGLAALAGFPIYRGMLMFTGHSLMNQTLLSGFSTDWLTDFSSNSPGSFQRYATLITALALLSIPVNSILAGGVLASFRAPEQASSVGEFFRNTARYAWRLVWLMILGLACYWIVFRFLNQGLGDLLDDRTRDWLSDRPVFFLHLGVYGLVFLGLAFVNLVMDYARVKLVMDEESNFLGAFLVSLGFSISRLKKAATVYAVPSLLSVAVLVLYRLVTPWWRINTYLSQPHAAPWVEPLTLAALFIGQQLIMFGRYFFRVAAWASEWSFFEARHSTDTSARLAAMSR